MDQLKTFPFTDEEMAEAGLLGEGASDVLEQVVATMREHPGLLDFNLFVLQCINERAKHNGTEPLVPPALTPGGETPYPSTPRGVSPDSPIFISEYERTTFYNGITPGGDHPELFYRSDLLTNPFPVPKDSHTSLPVKSARPVHGTPLNSCWYTVGPEIVSLLNNQKVHYSAIDPVRFFTYGPPGEEEKGTLGPITIWIALHPGTTTVEAAHDASLTILDLLKANGVEDAVVEWREGAPERLSGPPLLPVVDDTDPTYHCRRFLTAALGMPIAREDDDAQGSVAFFFHENRDKDNQPVDTVLGVSNCHVLRENTTVDYDLELDEPESQPIRVNGDRRFERGLKEIKKYVGNHGTKAGDLAREIIELEAKLKDKDPAEAEAEAKKDVEALVAKRAELANKRNDIDALNQFHDEIKLEWSDNKCREIGYVNWAPKVTVANEGRRYTRDIGTFVADPVKFSTNFKGNVVSLGARHTSKELHKLFESHGGGKTFEFPPNGQLRINGWVPREELADPDKYNLIVMKDGCTTDLTVGYYSGLESFVRRDLGGAESLELGIVNDYDKTFSTHGDSGSLIFDIQGRMVGVLHGGIPKGKDNHVTYATPAWWVIEELKKKYPHADFNRTSFY